MPLVPLAQAEAGSSGRKAGRELRKDVGVVCLCFVLGSPLHSTTTVCLVLFLVKPGEGRPEVELEQRLKEAIPSPRVVM